MRNHGVAMAVCALGVLLLLASCDEQDYGVRSQVIDPTGDWTMSTVETADPCELAVHPELVQDVRITRNGNTYELRIEGQPCSSPLVFSRSGANGAGTYSRGTPLIDTTINGCTFRSRTIETIHITQDTIDGAFLDSASQMGHVGYYGYGYYYDPDCPISCDVQRTVQGQRCEDCFDGCI